MYACVRETGRGFFEGVCGKENWPPTFRDPPLPPGDSRIGLCQRTVSSGSGRSEYLLTLRYLVPGKKPRVGAQTILLPYGMELCKRLNMTFGEHTFSPSGLVNRLASREYFAKVLR